MPDWPVTVAFTDDEAAALDDLAEDQFGGDREAALESVLDAWLDERGQGTSRFRR